MTCCPTKKLFDQGNKHAALTLFRVFFGFWLAYVGISKWLFFGADNFITMMSTQFASTWIPAQLLTLTGWTILILEPLLGVWLLIGCCQRQAWGLTSLLMFMLTFGMTVKMDPNVSANWIYLVLCLVALANTDSCCEEKEGGADKGCCK